MSSCIDTTKLLWEELFKDPSQFWDNRHRKKSIKSPDFRHKRSGQSLWIDGRHTPPWVHVKLQSVKLPCNSVDENTARLLEQIKLCGKEKDLLKAKRIRAEIDGKEYIRKNVHVGTALLHTYAKCGALREAREVFDQLPRRDVVCWNALISGYVENGLGDEALKCFRNIEDDGVFANEITYVCTLKACAITGSLQIGEGIHARLRDLELLKENDVLWNALINMYAKCGALQKAREVFDQFPERSIVSWNALIAGYARHGTRDQVMKCFEEMEDEGVFPNAITYISSLKACAIKGSLEIGEKLHVKARKQGLLNKNIVLGNTLIDMYVKCDAFKKACEVFNQIPERNVVSWNTLLSGYVKHGICSQALKFFQQMEEEGISPNSITYINVLKACTMEGNIEIGESIHSRIERQGLLKKDVVLGNSLVDMYAKFGALQKACELFNQLPDRNVVSWTSLISGYVENGLGDEAIKLFEQMVNKKISPDIVTYICVLRACGSVRRLELGKKIYAEVREQGLLKKDIVLGNTVLDMFVKCGEFQKACEVFDELPERDVVSWTTLLSGYVDNGHGDEALKCFLWMKDEGVFPNAVTYICTLKACAITRSLGIGEEIHAEVREQGLLKKYVAIGTTLVDMYAKCGALQKARDVFDQLSNRNIVSWNALIAGYAEHGLADEALKCFAKMNSDLVSPDVITYISVLKACAVLGSLEIGQEIHARVREQELLDKDIMLGTTLVDMYARCGMLIKAHDVFDQLLQRDVMSWNALMAGYARNGKVNSTLDLFRRMKKENVTPNLATFLVLLNACNHAALLEEGEKIFDDMISVYDLSPTVEHYTCMVDLLGRAGQFEKAKQFLLDEVPLLLAFMGACRKWMNVDLGRWAFEKILQLDSECASAYVCMANIYAAVGLQTEAENIKAIIVKHGTS